MDFRFYSHEYRKRKKEKEKAQNLIVLTNKNKALKQMLMQLRKENERLCKT